MADRSLSVQFLRLDHKRHRGSAMLLFGSHRLGEPAPILRGSKGTRGEVDVARDMAF